MINTAMRMLVILFFSAQCVYAETTATTDATETSESQGTIPVSAAGFTRPTVSNNKPEKSVSTAVEAKPAAYTVYAAWGTQANCQRIANLTGGTLEKTGKKVSVNGETVDQYKVTFTRKTQSAVMVVGGFKTYKQGGAENPIASNTLYMAKGTKANCQRIAAATGGKVEKTGEKIEVDGKSVDQYKVNFVRRSQSEVLVVAGFKTYKQGATDQSVTQPKISKAKVAKKSSGYSSPAKAKSNNNDSHQMKKGLRSGGTTVFAAPGTSSQQEDQMWSTLGAW